MTKIIATEWMSLDGIFDATGMAEWFNPYHSDSRAALISENIHNCSAMLYGRNTYQMLYPYWSAFKNNEMGVADMLNKTPKYVVSGTMDEAAWENSTIIREDVIETLKALKASGEGNILVQGSGTLVRSLLAVGLLDELKVMIQPHIMGNGLRFFTDDMSASLQCKQVKELDKGVVEITYVPAG
ncbi:dihydrofolate reductase family protein [Chitinophaga polysaccharea]|uniref:dihydrofolate reductase family protein n=1 Tax=Chitinophaga polysaccharea TaxID=1293035 RepID=UPI0014555D52|nr:dihydrofolate reductase family protein [Chitinophaga polysaccharea]NLR57741.1 dihydrofolate reductase family protein [Chitinophaga polysaccharea]